MLPAPLQYRLKCLSHIFRDAVETRPLTNPPARLPLPPYLKTTLSSDDPEKLFKGIKEALAANGTNLSAVERINIVWPHKHPKRWHTNMATSAARDLADTLQCNYPRIKFTLAPALHETVHLDRSGNQSSLHALTGRQIYAVDPVLQDEEAPIFMPQPRGPEYFILTDWMIEQGTTIANLASFIQHNGGTILAVADQYGDTTLRQKDALATRAERRALPSAMRAGQIPDLARTFRNAAAAAGMDMNAAQSVHAVESALQRHGRSLLTLTQGECTRLQYSLYGKSDFPALLEKLNSTAPAPADKLPQRIPAVA
ncbi:MAG: hypothetical protein KKA05_03640 [Alphaproteobacteria bacterium]|nr:hypothetical protein [Alphaproteobacteria bacterium]MBU0858891.1 hypothetical protein [Alphaproteobacteria bacterium]